MAFDLLHELRTKDAVAVSQEESRRGVPWKCLPELLNRPLGCGMRGDAEVHDPPPLVCEHEKDIEHLKSNGGDGKEVDGHHGADVVLKKRAPGLGGRTPSANQILADAALGNLDPEFEKLAMDSRSAPRRVFPTHAADQFTGVFRNSGPASLAVADLPCPERPKQLPVPADDCLRLNNHQPRPPVGAQPGDSDPEQAVRCVQPRTLRRSPAKDQQLMAQREVLHLQDSTRLRQ